MTFDDLNLSGRDIDYINITGDMLLLDTHHRVGFTHGEGGYAVCQKASLAFSGVKDLRMLMPTKGPSIESSDRNLWSPEMRLFIEKIAANDADFDINNHLEKIPCTKEITSTEFLMQAIYFQGKTKMPNGISDWYHKDNYLQLETHGYLRLQFLYTSCEITLQDDKDIWDGNHQSESKKIYEKSLS